MPAWIFSICMDGREWSNFEGRIEREKREGEERGIEREGKEKGDKMRK